MSEFIAWRVLPCSGSEIVVDMAVIKESPKKLIVCSQMSFLSPQRVSLLAPLLACLNTAAQIGGTWSFAASFSSSLVSNFPHLASASASVMLSVSCVAVCSAPSLLAADLVSGAVVFA